MNLNKSTHDALHAAVEMARLEAGETVTVGAVAARHGVSEGALAKVFQQLVRAGVAVGTRGVGGGYRLAREAATLSVLDIVDIFQPQRTASPPVGAAAVHDTSPEQRLLRLFEEVDELARNAFASTTLETLVR